MIFSLLLYDNDYQHNNAMASRSANLSQYTYDIDHSGKQYVCRIIVAAPQLRYQSTTFVWPPNTTNRNDGILIVQSSRHPLDSYSRSLCHSQFCSRMSEQSLSVSSEQLHTFLQSVPRCPDRYRRCIGISDNPVQRKNGLLKQWAVNPVHGLHHRMDVNNLIETSPNKGNNHPASHNRQSRCTQGHP